MRRSSYGFRKPRAKKIRPMVRIKERVAKKGGRCSGCRGRYEPGAEVTVVNIRRRVFHRHTCVPANINQMPSTGMVGGPIVATPESVTKALSTNWSIGEAKMVGMLALENALVVVAKNKGITPLMEKAFDRYNKLKAMAMNPGSENEGVMAARLAIIEVVKTVF